VNDVLVNYIIENLLMIDDSVSWYHESRGALSLKADWFHNRSNDLSFVFIQAVSSGTFQYSLNGVSDVPLRREWLPFDLHNHEEVVRTLKDGIEKGKQYRATKFAEIIERARANGPVKIIKTQSSMIE